MADVITNERDARLVWNELRSTRAPGAAGPLSPTENEQVQLLYSFYRPALDALLGTRRNKTDNGGASRDIKESLIDEVYDRFCSALINFDPRTGEFMAFLRSHLAGQPITNDEEAARVWKELRSTRAPGEVSPLSPTENEHIERLYSFYRLAVKGFLKTRRYTKDGGGGGTGIEEGLVDEVNRRFYSAMINYDPDAGEFIAFLTTKLAHARNENIRQTASRDRRHKMQALLCSHVEESNPPSNILVQQESSSIVEARYAGCRDALLRWAADNEKACDRRLVRRHIVVPGASNAIAVLPPSSLTQSRTLHTVSCLSKRQAWKSAVAQ